MNQRLIAQIGKSQRLEIVNHLKRSGGMTVRQLSETMKLSYMGVKAHCVSLGKQGYVTTWRMPRPIGRPELLYRLTRRAHELFPVAANSLTLSLLDCARELYGSTSAEKVLFMHFEREAERYKAQVRGDSVQEKARWLARLRDRDGWMSALETEPKLKIIENHSPILDLLEAYPLVQDLEQRMFSNVLNAPVRRVQEQVDGVYRCEFRVRA